MKYLENMVATTRPLPSNCDFGTVTTSNGVERCIFLHVTRNDNINNRKCIIDAVFTKNDAMFIFAGDPSDAEQDRLIRILSATGPYRRALAASEELL
jgi:hypothetical protein